MAIRQMTRNDLVSVSATTAVICKEVVGNKKRTQVIITANTAGVTVTISKGETAAVATYGLPLQSGSSYVEATDGGFTCWQGAIQAVASGAGNVSIVETFDVYEQ
jgi:hypothetical protein